MAMLFLFDKGVLSYARRHSLDLLRWAIFLVYGWFGILKVLGASPASPLVHALLDRTMPVVPLTFFLAAWGLYEILIGIAFLWKGWERLAIALLVPHILIVCSPLVLLPGRAWQSFLVPSLEGQYIIKNVFIVALLFLLAAQLQPLPAPKKTR